ncbi:MAG: HAMP domain-containing protein [Candidatus Omnitrophica bacterium]|nr:HAMP domain-containing protein [Candidatus Omnitrophota bacterium]
MDELKIPVKKERLTLSILQKYLIVTISLLVLAILASSIFFLNNIRNMIRTENMMRLETLSSSLAQNSKEATLSWDYTLLIKICTNVIEETDILYLTLFDDTGRIIGDSDQNKVGKTNVEAFNKIINYEYDIDEDNNFYIEKVRYENEEILEIKREIRIDDRLIGALILGASQERMKRLVSVVTVKIFLISLGILIFGVIVAVIFVRTLTQPIKLLHLGAQKIGSGDLEHRIQIKTRDEIGELAVAFNEMTEKMSTGIQKLDQQNLELKEFDRLKSEFLANTSHELRTPLNGIIGLVDSILDGADGPVNAEQDRHMQMVKKCSVSLLELVNNLLDLSKLEAGLMEFDVQEFNLKDVMDTVMPIAEGLVRDKPDVNVKLEVHT